jgi:hypothetical protein
MERAHEKIDSKPTEAKGEKETAGEEVLVIAAAAHAFKTGSKAMRALPERPWRAALVAGMVDDVTPAANCAFETALDIPLQKQRAASGTEAPSPGVHAVKSPR